MGWRTFILGLYVKNSTVALDVSIKARYHRVDLGESRGIMQSSE